LICCLATGGRWGDGGGEEAALLSPLPDCWCWCCGNTHTLNFKAGNLQVCRMEIDTSPLKGRRAAAPAAPRDPRTGPGGGGGGLRVVGGGAPGGCGASSVARGCARRTTWWRSSTWPLTIFTLTAAAVLSLENGGRRRTAAPRMRPCSGGGCFRTSPGDECVRVSRRRLRKEHQRFIFRRPIDFSALLVICACCLADFWAPTPLRLFRN